MSIGKGERLKLSVLVEIQVLSSARASLTWGRQPSCVI